MNGTLTPYGSGGGGNGPASAIQSQSPIESAIREADHSLSNLRSLIDQLDQRLSSILTIIPGIENQIGSSDGPHNLADRITVIIGGIQSECGHVKSMLERLQL